MVAVGVLGGPGLEQDVDAAIRRVGQRLGHGHGRHGLGLAAAVQHIGLHVPAVHRQHGVQRLVQVQPVAQQGGVVLPPVGLAQGHRPVLHRHALDLIRACQHHVGLGVVVALGPGQAAARQRIAQDVAAQLIAVGVSGGVVHAGGKPVVRPGVVEIAHPEVPPGAAEEGGGSGHGDGLFHHHLMVALGGQAAQRDREDGGAALGVLGAGKVEGGVGDGDAAHMAVKGQVAGLLQDVLRCQLPGGRIHGEEGRVLARCGGIARNVQNARLVAQVHPLGNEALRKARDDELRFGPAEEVRELALVTVGLGGHGLRLGVSHFRAFGRSRGGGSRSRRSGLRGCAAAAACQQQSSGKAHGAKGAFGGVAHRQKVSFRVSPYLRNSSGRKAWVWAALPSAVSTEK